MPKDNRKKLDASLNYVTDVLSGDGGGIPFVKFLAFIREMADRADKGDEDAKQILEVVYRFERLVKLPQTDK